MSYEVPWELLPLVRALGVEWPDLNEDAISDMGCAFRDFGSAVADLGWTVEHHLGHLAKECRSDTLSELATFWRRLQIDVLDRGDVVCGQIGRLCDDSYNAIHAYKAALLGWLTVELGALAITFPESMPAVIALRGPLQYAGDMFLAEATDKLIDFLANGPERLLKEEFEKQATKVLGHLEDAAFQRLAHVVPEGHLGALEGELFLDAVALATAKERIEKSYVAVERAAKALKTAPHKVDHAKGHPHMFADHRLRKVAVLLLHDLCDLLGDTVLDLCGRLLARVTGVITAHEDYLRRVDHALAAATPSGAVPLGTVGPGDPLQQGGTVVATFPAPKAQGIPLRPEQAAGQPRPDAAARARDWRAEGMAGGGAEFLAAWKRDGTTPWDQWGFWYNGGPEHQGAGGDCTSFVAWRLNQIAKAQGLGDTYFTNSSVGGHPGKLGDAGSWNDSAPAMGFTPDGHPRVGAVVQTERHVAIVTAVNPDGTVTIEDSSAPWDKHDSHGNVIGTEPGYVYRQSALTMKDGHYQMNGKDCVFLHFVPGT